ncbi:5-deoxy-glucuronate isomerase [Sulfobacillus acidophilus]|uniref:5-deoxy-glucuronate isomerase n=1 Tax=Sulfobacillus acidophilus TaxID=53633 RepID=A0ABS3AVQ5_9FIRM|nr:5-deoxy-glucuronate isomerase [Sulfobacillus acidophilus]
MNQHIIHKPHGFNAGLSVITGLDEANFQTGIRFSILKLQAGEKYQSSNELERAFLLLTGDLSFNLNNVTGEKKRQNIFDEAPTAFHLPKDEKIIFTANSNCEIAIFETKNNNTFDATVFDEKNTLENEHRGKGKLNNTAYRIVRTIFDKRNRPKSNLVLGEVINFPGCWSSYPPHHHIQPEIYHYRFTKEQGYGHGELGDDVFKIRQYDTLKILDEKDHAQVAAPGYGMYYIWAIRHLPNNPYIAPQFTKEHEWTLYANN